MQLQPRPAIRRYFSQAPGIATPSWIDTYNAILATGLDRSLEELNTPHTKEGPARLQRTFYLILIIDARMQAANGKQTRYCRQYSSTTYSNFNFLFYLTPTDYIQARISRKEVESDMGLFAVEFNSTRSLHPFTTPSAVLV
jgi:hypothetical protein